ncbi:MAG: tol-pal system protein YbgF [Pseudorhodobacter sp.]|jgi:tol-pal system protein YbgF
MRAAFIGLVIGAVLPLCASAQDRAQTLADIRQELVVLNSSVMGLKRELSTTSGFGSVPVGGDVLDRVDAIEAALSQLTSKTEGLEFRINQIVADGTNRIGDLEFRLVELEGGDLGSIGQTPTLGGETGVAIAPVAPAPATGSGSLATNEQGDFDRAKEVLAQGDFRRAADLFATFTQTYTGGPLTAEAHFMRGEALSGLGETGNAARAWLEAFSSDMAGPRAPESLLKVGQALSVLGQGPEACVTLAEVSVRFPGTQAASDAAVSVQGLGCQ